MIADYDSSSGSESEDSQVVQKIQKAPKEDSSG